MNTASPILNILNSFKTIATLDVETTTKNKGNPFTAENKLVCVTIKVGHLPTQCFYSDSFHIARDLLASVDLAVGFNIKFDIHWLRRELGYFPTSVWDCQYAEFLFSDQTWKYPSLQETCEKRGLEGKIDIVKEEYWNKGIDTDQIPREVLTEYAIQDVEQTYEVFKKQIEIFANEKPHQFKLFRLHCNDLLVLAEMEWNGIKYDVQGSLDSAEQIKKQVQYIEQKLSSFEDGVPINWDSRDQVSVFLYGGKIVEELRVPIGVYKTGTKAGQPRYKIMVKEHYIERKVDPLKGTENKKEGYWSTDEAALRSLKCSKTVRKAIDWILERAKLQKLNSTYLEGLPNTITEFGWEDNLLHSNLNQCVTVSGRLSSTKPNQQNLNSETKMFCVTRF